MLIVAERINASRKAVRAALEKLDAAAIVNEVRIQAAAGAHYIDLNGGTFPGREAELLCSSPRHRLRRRSPAPAAPPRAPAGGAAA